MKTVKKILIGIGCTIGVVAGFLLIWNVVIPFIGKILSGFLGLLG